MFSANSLAQVFIVVILSLSTFQKIAAQNIHETVNFINYSIKDGLPSSETYDVFQDSKGYIWIGTDNGVVRYDGANFKTFTTRDGLTDNTIFKIYEDKKERLWFITYNRKLCYYENNKFVPFQYNKELNDFIGEYYVGNTITNFEIDSLDNLRFSCVSLVGLTYSEFVVSNQGNVSEVAKESEKEALLKAQFAETKAEILIQSLPIFNSINLNSKLLLDSEILGRVHIYNGEKEMKITSKQGVDFFDKRDGTINKTILSDFYITGICTDFEGGLWCSSLYNGVFYIPNPQIEAFRVGSQFSKSHNDAIFQQGADLYFSYNQDRDLYKIQPKSSVLELEKNKQLNFWEIPKKQREIGVKFENPITPESVFPAITSFLFLDSSTILAAGVRQQLVILRQAKNIDKKKLKITGTTIDPFNNIWLRTKEGHYLEKDQLFRRILPSVIPKILKLLRDSKGKIWVGTLNGLFEFDPVTETTTLTNQFESFNSFRIQDIVESNNGTLFFATKANGVFISSNNQVLNIKKSTGLLSNTVNQLIYDSLTNVVWVATNNGISALVLNKNNEWVAETRISKFDGLGLTDIRQLYFFDDWLYFASNDGIGRVKTKNLNKRISAPILKIKSIEINGELLSLNSNLSFPHDSNNFLIQYQAIGFKSQNNFEYWYKIHPLHNEWQKTSNSNITLPSLLPGTYNLVIKAKNIDNVFSDVQTSSFTITPAFWMTLWFKIGIVFIALLIGYRASLETIRIYKNQAKFQRIINEMQVVSLQSKMSPHFIFNSLNSIQNYILKNEPKQANEYLLEFSKLIRIILQNSDSTSILLHKEMDILNMYVDLESKRLRSSFNYNVILDESINIERCLIPSLLIQPYIENSIWHGKVHTNPEGFIQISIRLKNDTLFFEITDNGIGIKNAQSSKINKPSNHKSVGTAITKKRIQLLAELNNKMSEVEISELKPNLTSNKYVGTSVKFSIPYLLKKSTHA